MYTTWGPIFRFSLCFQLFLILDVWGHGYKSALLIGNVRMRIAPMSGASHIHPMHFQTICCTAPQCIKGLVSVLNHEYLAAMHLPCSVKPFCCKPLQGYCFFFSQLLQKQLHSSCALMLSASLEMFVLAFPTVKRRSPDIAGAGVCSSHRQSEWCSQPMMADVSLLD